MIYTCKHKPAHVHNNEYKKVLHEIEAHLHHKVTTENEQKENNDNTKNTVLNN